MPRSWHDRHTVNKLDGDEKVLYRALVADRKPYFMRYIYPSLMREYNTYIKKANKNAYREFKMSVDELKEIPIDERTEAQSTFLDFFDRMLPVGVGDCVMNKICRRFEDEFDGYIGKHNTQYEFDYSILKSGAEYPKNKYYEVKKLYDNYNNRLKNYMIFSQYERVEKSEATASAIMMRDEFIRECSAICSNSTQLCDIVIDICYKRSATKKFAWSMCAADIIRNLLSKNDNIICVPIVDENGDMEYNGSTYSEVARKVEVEL